MSYIHEALKKAQREKDLLVSKPGTLQPGRRGRPRTFKPEWLVPMALVVIAVAFLSRSWSNSGNQHPPAEQGRPVFRQAVSEPSQAVKSSKPPAVSPATASKNAKPTPGTDKETNPTKLAQNRAEGRDKGQAEKAGTEKSRSEAANALYTRALSLQKAGRLQEGKKLYEAALEQSPRLVSALNNLGTIYIKEKQYPAAGKALQKAIRIKPGYVDPYYNLACLHALQKDVGRSLFYLKKAISIDKEVRRWARIDKDLKNLHGHAEYENIINTPQET